MQRVLHYGGREQLPVPFLDLPRLGERLVQPAILQLQKREIHLRDGIIRIDLQGTSKRRTRFRPTACRIQKITQQTPFAGYQRIALSGFLLQNDPIPQPPLG